jgi:hypothetical protein
MRRFDKKLNIDKVNILFEQRYIKSKSIIVENKSKLEEDWKTNLAAGLASIGSVAGTNVEKQDTTQTTQTTQQGVGVKPETNMADPFNVNSQLKSTPLLTINFSKSFKSGSYTLSNEFEKQNIDKLKQYINDNPNSNYVIYITASESKVPNQQGFGTGKLAEARASVLEKLIKANIPVDKVKFKVEAIVGGPEWDKKDKNDLKYTKHQFIILELFDAGVTPCSLSSIDDKGYIATKDKGFISNNIKITGSGSFEMTPGKIPDRLQLIKDGNIIFDTKYYANDNPYKEQWNYTPLHIAMLTELYKENKNTKAFANLQQDVKQFKSYEDLVSFLLRDKKLNPENDKRREVAEGLAKLKMLFNQGQTEFLFYTIKPPSIAKVDADVKNPITLLTYSPLGSTAFGLKGMDCR